MSAQRLAAAQPVTGVALCGTPAYERCTAHNGSLPAPNCYMNTRTAQHTPAHLQALSGNLLQAELLDGHVLSCARVQPQVHLRPAPTKHPVLAKHPQRSQQCWSWQKECGQMSEGNGCRKETAAVPPWPPTAEQPSADIWKRCRHAAAHGAYKRAAPNSTFVKSSQSIARAA